MTLDYTPAGLHAALTAVTSDTDAAEACRILIRAYARDPQHVDWNDVQGALAHALRAFGLPEDYPEEVARTLDMLDDKLDAAWIGILDDHDGERS